MLTFDFWNRFRWNVMKHENEWKLSWNMVKIKNKMVDFCTDFPKMHEMGKGQKWGMTYMLLSFFYISHRQQIFNRNFFSPNPIANLSNPFVKTIPKISQIWSSQIPQPIFSSNKEDQKLTNISNSFYFNEVCFIFLILFRS